MTVVSPALPPDRPITIGQITVPPGTRQLIDLPLPSLYTNTSESMPVHVWRGRKPGVRLGVCAAIHGDEINGVEIIRRLLNHTALKSLRGTLIAVPVVNVYGFISQSRYLPDRRDLNRSFPGSETGSMASRLAHIFMTQIVSQCTHLIDLHTGAIGRENLPQIRAQVLSCPVTAELAHAFGAPVIMNSEFRDGSLREAAQARNIPVLLYEAGEALRFDELAIHAGVQGILRVMAHLGMIPSRKRSTRSPEMPARSPARLGAIVAKSSLWVRATQSGILRAVVKTGDRVEKNQVLAYINTPAGSREQTLRSPVSGIIIGKTNLPLVYEGDASFHIARFAEVGNVADQIGALHDQLQDQLQQQSPPDFSEGLGDYWSTEPPVCALKDVLSPSDPVNTSTT